jgi:microcystin-dependent protein
MEGYIAEIRLFAASFAPKNWAYCQGQIMAIAQNQALFSLLGTTYGGDGRTTFALPNLAGRTAISPGMGPGQPNYNLGQPGGENNHTLTIQEMPAHIHTGTVNASTNGGAGSDPTNTLLASGTRAAPMSNIYATGAANAAMGAGSIAVDNSGNSQPHYNMQPYLGMNYIICLYGIYPSRN